METHAMRRSRLRQAAFGGLLVVSAFMALPTAQGAVALSSPDTRAGYIAHLLVNEAPFPGERGWMSEADTKGTMLAILWVLQSRIAHIPSGYRQEQIAATRSSDIIDVITVGGEKGQCDGFYRAADGTPSAVTRVHKRIAYLTRIGNDGKPGRFARLLQYAQGTADAYERGGIQEADRFAGLSVAARIPVTGRAYSWMTDKDCYNPGGNFVRIPDTASGSLGGNRFFTLKKQ
jgi:hypothetical protein